MTEGRLRRLAIVLILPFIIGGLSVWAYNKVIEAKWTKQAEGFDLVSEKNDHLCKSKKSDECDAIKRDFVWKFAARGISKDAAENAASGLLWAIVPSILIFAALTLLGWILLGKIPNLARKPR